MVPKVGLEDTAFTPSKPAFVAIPSQRATGKNTIPYPQDAMRTRLRLGIAEAHREGDEWDLASQAWLHRPPGSWSCGRLG